MQADKGTSRNDRITHLANGELLLAGADDHFHLKNIALGRACLDERLKHILLVQAGAAVTSV